MDRLDPRDPAGTVDHRAIQEQLEQLETQVQQDLEDLQVHEVPRVILVEREQQDPRDL